MINKPTIGQEVVGLCGQTFVCDFVGGDTAKGYIPDTWQSVPENPDYIWERSLRDYLNNNFIKASFNPFPRHPFNSGL